MNRRVGGILFLLAAIATAALIAFSGIAPRIRARKALREETNLLAAVPVTIVHPRRASPAEEVVLPGNIQAYTDAPIYARTDGYLKRWYFDIGAHVKKGALLAEIESPEIDQQLMQAREEVNTAQANLHLSQITSERYTGLFKTDSVAKQDVDNAVQDAAAKAATVKSAQANVARLEQMVAFEKIYAPFDGIVTARRTDVGQLIQSGSSGGAARELFHVAAIDRLRVFVNIPQDYSHDAKPGLSVDLTLPEIPGRRFPGMLVRTAGAIDPATRTLTVEVDVSNKTGLLFPGAYTEVHFKIKSKGLTLIIPSTSVMFRGKGLQVPVVQDGRRITLKPVTPGRDFGSTIEIISGLSAEDAVVANPPDSLIEGERVRVVTPQQQNEATED
jgi:RND family efflux transporter MFP subunit